MLLPLLLLPASSSALRSSLLCFPHAHPVRTCCYPRRARLSPAQFPHPSAQEQALEDKNYVCLSPQSADSVLSNGGAAFAFLSSYDSRALVIRRIRLKVNQFGKKEKVLKDGFSSGSLTITKTLMARCTNEVCPSCSHHPSALSGLLFLPTPIRNCGDAPFLRREGRSPSNRLNKQAGCSLQA
mmetsp:Transcript_11765/g.18870  ORF Transcript_11765/g.18870 Transcript_11765/m.18870 type:complete len:183 (+) Transcript_11765:289-837(+)